ncbi:zf-HC2 domain-containing protein [Actinoplanes bogorensis]|uniref:Zf-HC2 domain-containing protein n=1 Tax=Paractinoplanes bogorensis TaxID=1610840 RepID=A0ABS5YW66_9ACTN|nr:zf-HC2 domain-containing protein [Actinoplanes bogorensis]MBU2667691.1 zf-HC2 domain-containing protein [Actinoplanes bogorensis]
MHCEHEHDDGAYVLGALSPAERAAYEGHLATCSFCREAVADISALPDLLSRLDAREFAKLLDPSLTSGDGHPGAAFRDWATSEWATLSAEAKRGTPSSSAPDGRRGKKTRSKAFRVRVMSSAAAVVLVALVAVGILAWTRDNAAPAAGPTGPATAMTAVQSSSPVTASVRLTSTSGGTKVDLLCSYSAAASRPYTFRLIAYGPDEQKEQLGSWQATPGAEFSMPGVTHFGRDALSRLELVQFDGKVLLAYDVP